MTNMTALTFGDARRYLADAVADRGDDYTYEPDPRTGECEYAQPDAAGILSVGCIVGHVLHHGMGFRLGALTTSAPMGVDTLLALLNVDADERTRNLLGNVQELQDDGESWGEAVREVLAWDAGPVDVDTDDEPIPYELTEATR